MAALIFIMFFALLGFSPGMSNADRTMMLIGHSSIGTIITMLMLVRISKRFILKHERPNLHKASKRATAAKLTHHGLYLLMILVPLTGFLTAYFHQLPVQLFGSILLNGSANIETFTALRLVHSTLVITLIVLVTLHVVAALIHKFVLRDDVLRSMRPWFAKNK
jgi:cytochrome b561